MAAITFSVKLDTEKDADLVAWLQSCESKSYEIKAALLHYRGLPPPPPQAPISSGPIDPSLAKVLEDLNATVGGLPQELWTAIVCAMNGTPLPPEAPLVNLSEQAPPPSAVETAKAKRPARNGKHAPEPIAATDASETALEEATVNFLTAFG